MAAPLVRFTWAKRAEGAGAWRWGLFCRVDRERRRRHGLVISLRGLTVWLGVLVVTGYLGLVTAWYVWLERRPHNYVTWLDAVLAPARWEIIREKRGDAYIAEGMDDFRAGHWSEGAMKLRVGLERTPDARMARQQLAVFLLAARRRDQAVALIRDGLRVAYPGREYITQALDLFNRSQDWASSRDVIDLALKTPGGAAAHDQSWLRAERAKIDLAAGEAAAALGWAESQPRSDPLARETRVLALLELGRAPEALALTEDWVRSVVTDLPMAWRLQARAARELDDLARMETALEALRRLTPADPVPYVYGVIQRALAHSPNVVSSLEDYLFRFGSSLPNLVLMANPLVDVGRGDLFAIVERAAMEQGFVSPELTRAHLAVAIDAADWGRAREALTQFEAMIPSESGGWSEIMDRLLVVMQDSGDGARIALIETFSERPQVLALYVRVLDWLRAAGRWAAISDILVLARRDFGDQPRWDELEVISRAGMAAEAAQAAQVQSATMVVPPTGVDGSVVAPEHAERRADETDHAVAGEAAFFRRVEDQVAAGDGPGALRTIIATRNERPGWLGGRTRDLERIELEARFLADDVVGFLAVTRFVLDGSNARGLEMMAWVSRFDAAGRRYEAEQLVTEILRDLPNFPPAKRQQARWAGEVPAKASP